MIAGSIEIQLLANVARLQKDMDQARQAVGNATAGMERAANAAKAALAGIGAGLGLSQIIQMSDQYAKFTAQLRLASTSAREYAAAYGDVKRIATAAQQDLAATGTLYARIVNGTRELGTSQKQVAAITETVNMALKVSGATAQESASAQLQLAQAFASGTLRGEEFNAVNEAAPRLMKALADGMGVPIGSLKAMATEGKITSAIMADVLPRALEDLRREAAEVQTIAGAFTVLKNNIMEFVGVQANASGGVAVLTGAIGMLANNLGLLAGAMLTVMAAKIGTAIAAWTVQTYAQIAASVALRAATIASAQAGAADTSAKVAQLGATQAMIVVAREEAMAKLAGSNANIASAQTAIAAASAAGAQSFALRALKLATAELAVAEAGRAAMIAQLAVLGQQQARVSAQVAAATTAQAAAQTALNATTGAGAVTAGLASRALGFLGGPIGAIITLLGLGATAWAVWGNKAKEGNDMAKESAVEASGVIIAELDKQIAKNQRIIEMRKQGDTYEQANKNMKNTAALGALGNDLSALNRGDGRYGSMSNEDKFFERQKIMKSILDLQGKINLAETTGLAAKAMTQAEARNKFMGEYATKQEQMNAKLKEARDLLGTSFTAADEARIRKHYEVKVAGSKAAAGASKVETEADKLRLQQQKEIADAAAEAIKIQAEYGQRLGQSVLEANREADANEELVRTFGMSKAAIAELEIARMEERLERLHGIDMADDEIAALRLVIAEKKRSAAALANLDTLTSSPGVTQAKELLDILVAVDNATKSAADGMAQSFGRVGSAIGGLTVALSEYGVRQQAIVAQLAAAKAKPENHDKIAKLEIAAAHASAQAKIKSYGDMANAAKGFFKENSRGYKVMEGVEKAYRATEMAMAIQTMLTKSGLVQAFTGLFVASKATETAATVASVGPDVAASMAKGTAAAAVGVAQQAQGDPYTAWPRMAAMAAVMAALGFAVAGASKGDTTAKDRQAATGTGSVLGDSSAKSQSIARAIEISASNSNIELGYTSRMLRALLSIENSMLNLGGLLLRNGDVGGALPGKELGSAAAFASSSKGQLMLGGPIGAVLNAITGGWLGKVTGQVFNAIFGGNVKTIDGGIMAGATSLGNARNGGFNASSYIDTKKDGGWFSSDKYRTATTSLGGEANQQFSLVLANMATAVSEAGKLLGIGGDAFTQRLNAFVVDIGKISTKDLKPEEIQKQIEAAFSKVGDDMARWSVAGITQFQKVGEGALETLVRVASNYANLDSVLQSIGMAFGATGLASIGAREEFIALVGGIDDLAGKASEFADNFLTEAERLAPVQKYVTEQLAAMNLAHLNSRDAFKGHLLSLNPAIAAEREQIAALLDLQGAFAKVHAATEDLTKSEQAIADERKDLQSQLDQLILSETQMLAKRRAEIAPTNRLLFDQVQALQAHREAQDAAKSSMTGLIDRMKSFGDSARSLRDGLLMGGLSTLTLEQQYAEARRQRDSTLAAAMGGDTTAQGNLSAMQTAFLTISQKVNGGDARYSSDFAEVLRISNDVANWTTGQIDTAQASLNVMNDQLAQLVQMNAIMQTLADAANTAPIANIGVLDYSSMGTANTAALVNEVKALRTSNEALANEVKGLRADQQQQTGDMIVAAEQISNRESETVVRGVGDALGRGRNDYANGVNLA